MPLLSELSEMIVDCEHKTAPVQDDGYPSIRTPNIGRGYFILEGVNRVSEETYRAWTKRAIPKPGDLIMARESPVGNVAMIPEGLEPCLGQRTLLIRPDLRKVDPAYLTYLLLGDEVQGSIHAKTNGSTVPHLNMKDVRELPLPELPDLPTQRRIAGILSAYDELIANNQRRIAILEEMARALYREWFVHYRAPGVVMGEDGVPEGWEVKRLREIADSVRRSVAKGEIEDAVPYLGLEHIPRRALALDAWEHTTELGSSKLEFQKGDILFGKIRPYFHKVSVAPFDGLCSSDTIVIRAKAEKFRALATCCAASDEFVAHATATSNGSKMPRADWKVLKEYTVAVPPTELLERFSAVVTNAIEQMQTLVFQNQNLRRTRDLLLPRLMSGRVEVSTTAIEQL